MHRLSRGRRRLVLAGCGVATLAMLASATMVSFRAGATWSAMEEQKEQLRRKFNARSNKREPLWGEVIKGTAFSHYRRALAVAKPLSRQLPPAAKLFAINDEQLATEVAPFRAQWAPMLDSLREGAHSANASPPPLGEEPETSIENLLDCRWVVNIAILEARVLRHEGRDVEAAQRTLDAAQFGADLMRRGSLINQMIAVAMLTIATDCWPEEKLSRLDRSALDLLASGLERLDRSLPETLDLTGELLYLSHSLRWADADDSWVPSFEWRYGFSSRWMIADAFLQVAHAASELEADATVPWSKRQAQIDEWFKRLSEGANPVVSIMIPNFTSAERNLRQALAILRLLRASLELHRGNEAPSLRDPLGDGPLLVSADAAGVKLRSAGTLRDQPLERTFVH